MKNDTPRGWTVIHLLIVLTLVLIFAVSFYDAVGNAKFLGRTESCRSNLRVIGTSITSYQIAHDGKMPLNWKSITPVLGSTGPLLCPVTGYVDSPTYTKRSYTYRYLIHPQRSDIICWDSGPHLPDHSIFVWLNRPFRNVLYASGKVAILPEDKFEDQGLKGECLILETWDPVHGSIQLVLPTGIKEQT